MTEFPPEVGPSDPDMTEFPPAVGPPDPDPGMTEFPPEVGPPDPDPDWLVPGQEDSRLFQDDAPDSNPSVGYSIPEDVAVALTGGDPGDGAESAADETDAEEGAVQGPPEPLDPFDAGSALPADDSDATLSGQSDYGDQGEPAEVTATVEGVILDGNQTAIGGQTIGDTTVEGVIGDGEQTAIDDQSTGDTTVAGEILDGNQTAIDNQSTGDTTVAGEILNREPDSDRQPEHRRHHRRGSRRWEPDSDRERDHPEHVGDPRPSSGALRAIEDEQAGQGLDDREQAANLGVAAVDYAGNAEEQVELAQDAADTGDSDLSRGRA